MKKIPIPATTGAVACGMPSCAKVPGSTIPAATVVSPVSDGSKIKTAWFLARAVFMAGSINETSHNRIHRAVEEIGLQTTEVQTWGY